MLYPELHEFVNGRSGIPRDKKVHITDEDYLSIRGLDTYDDSVFIGFVEKDGGLTLENETLVNPTQLRQLAKVFQDLAEYIEHWKK